MLKHLKFAGIILFFSVLFMGFGIHLNSNRVLRLAKGNYFFEQTRNSSIISQIVISFPNNNTVSVVKKGDLWHIKEADDYFASFLKINSLVSLIRSTIIFRADTIKNNVLPFKKEECIKISSIDNKGNIVDEAFIAPKMKENKHHYALLNGEKFLYQISGNYNITSNAMDWVQMPILKITEKEIKEIKCDKFHLYRRYSEDVFINVNSEKVVDYVDSFINSLWYLSSDKIYHSVNFDMNSYKRVKDFQISLFNGIIYNISFYEKNEEYVVNIKLDNDFLMSNEGINWLKENSILYDGWYFKIPKERGKVLVNYSI